MLLIYEIIMVVAFAGVLLWAIRSRDPINLGAIAGGFLMSYFDWLWCSRGFWNATTEQSLLMVPGLEIQGIRYPISICFVWAVGFGFVPALAATYRARITQVLGGLHVPVILASAVLIDLAVEYVGVTVLGAWTYHQAPRWLIGGLPWSNFWFLGGVLAVTYFGLATVRRWADIPAGSGVSLRREETWKGMLMAASLVLGAAFLLGTLQLFWWSATTPWIESGRPF